MDGLIRNCFVGRCRSNVGISLSMSLELSQDRRTWISWTLTHVEASSTASFTFPWPTETVAWLWFRYVAFRHHCLDGEGAIARACLGLYLDLSLLDVFTPLCAGAHIVGIRVVHAARLRHASAYHKQRAVHSGVCTRSGLSDDNDSE